MGGEANVVVEHRHPFLSLGGGSVRLGKSNEMLCNVACVVEDSCNLPSIVKGQSGKSSEWFCWLEV